MRRLTIAGAVLSLALGSALAVPLAAQAATSAPAASTSAVRQAVSPNLDPGTEFEFFGLTYPDTTAGLEACQAEGASLHAGLPAQDLSSECLFGNPNKGVYNLWILFRSVD
jgi:hypothetical protein